MPPEIRLVKVNGFSYYVAESEEYGKPADRWDSHFKLGMERNRIP